MSIMAKELDSELPQIEPTIPVFLLYVVILQELVSGWMEYKRQASKPKKQARPVWSSRIVTVVLVAVSVVWIPILQSANSGQLYVYIQSVTSYLAPPVTAVFVLAVFWKRANEQGAFWGLMVGLVVGLVRMIMEFIYPVPRCGVYDERPAVLKDVHYLHFAIILCMLTCGIVVGVSLLTEPPLQSHLKNLTWWTISRDRNSPEISMQKLNTANRASRRDKEEADRGVGAPATRSWSSRICGTRAEVGDEVPKPLHIKNTRSTAEDPFWARVCCINAIILMCINIFFYAYFA